MDKYGKLPVVQKSQVVSTTLEVVHGIYVGGRKEKIRGENEEEEVAG